MLVRCQKLTAFADFRAALWQFFYMKIKDLLSALPEFSSLGLSTEAGLHEVQDLISDSRKAQPGCVFVAIRGHQVDSHDFLSTVAAQGAAALIVENKKKVPADFQGVVIEVKNSREALELLASRFNDEPSRKLLVFGVTGTNGKTSSTYMLEHICNLCGFSTGVIGTIDHHLRERVWPTSTTTPGPLELQSRLREMRELGAKVLAMEVSSHALSQNRVDSVHFNTVLFTNLTQDHLDYHQSMAGYFDAKQRLFTDLLWKSAKVPQFAIVNVDDRYGRRLRVAGHAEIWTYGKNKNADFRFQVEKSEFSRTQFELRTPFGSRSGIIPLCGEHNVYNAVGVIASCAALGIPVAYSLEALASFNGVPGRLQTVTNKRNIHVMIDYAHTPHALENALQAIRKVRSESNLPAKIITVFGCGGDRDKGKRPIMGGIAEKLSDLVIVTSDNPRMENPMAIISDILTGFKNTKPFIESDRRKAIALAVTEAREGDVILIAGKGHEDYQIVGKDKVHFSDIEVAKEILA
jgi:UDP-N-acetylmuramoyl-L-alanyl-D-glutamate--2,6-diaminopimelate ligase